MASTGSVKDATKYLATQQAESPPELAAEWANLEELYNKKLWHQITLKLGTFVKHPFLQSGDKLIQLYSNFIQGFENKINPLALVEIIAIVVQQYENSKDAVAFLQQTEPKVQSCAEAVALCKVLAGSILLNKLEDQAGTKKVIDEVGKLLDDEDGVTPVHGRYYQLASDLYRLQSNYAEYYRASLRYLGCSELDTLSSEDKINIAAFLGLAALLGEGVYNFGELLAHPVLESLEGTPAVWIKQLLIAFNQGDIAKFEQMRPSWESMGDLVAHEKQLREKITLLCLMEMTFKRPSNNRILTFAEIAKETQLPVTDVEFLVMKALSLNLVKGAIDQVSQNVHMTWVQPRVLDKNQINGMIQRLNAWCNDVKLMENLMEEKAHEILTL
ncbi:26S proteasome non-ATPase regulatory subunit 13 [Neocloeon triangulifer]|uniref:26S proteasome non-ATPase regulatory subunit 13 n=1 Tax=Neocloeon triangulifer TaxID=2078957 RepID=UPI00286F07A1|nr:26S proteasome non-ATPase regulatory subunit 13 [Neocloeon triangulifer]